MALETGTYINDLVITNPVGPSDPKSQGDDHLRLIKATLKSTFPNANKVFFFPDKGADIASATTITIPADGDFHHVTGTVTVAGIATIAIGEERTLVFDGILQLTNSATFILSGGANITTAAGDVFRFREETTPGTWRMVGYALASGSSISKLKFGSDAQGDVTYYDGTNWVRLGAGTSGHFLKTQGAAANPLWAVSEEFASGTIMVFVSAAPPVGWTASGFEDWVLRFTNGAGGGTGGAVSINGGAITIASHILTVAELPPLTFSMTVYRTSGGGGAIPTIGGTSSEISQNTNTLGSGSAHGHSGSTYNIRYKNVVAGTKD